MKEKVESGDLVVFVGDWLTTAGRMAIVLDAGEEESAECFSVLADDGCVWRFVARQQVMIVQKHTHRR